MRKKHTKNHTKKRPKHAKFPKGSIPSVSTVDIGYDTIKLISNSDDLYDLCKLRSMSLDVGGYMGEIMDVQVLNKWVNASSYNLNTYYNSDMTPLTEVEIKTGKVNETLRVFDDDIHSLSKEASRIGIRANRNDRIGKRGLKGGYASKKMLNHERDKFTSRIAVLKQEKEDYYNDNLEYFI